MKKWIGLILAAALLLSGCGGSKESVYVQSVEALSNMGGIAPGDHFLGLVVSEHVTKIEKDSDKAVKELLVQEGDDVKEGQELFSYDTDELQLNYDKKCLELEQLKASIESYKTQIKQLENERAFVTGSEKLRYTLEIQSTQLDMKEAELKIKTKEKEVEQAAQLLENSTVVSPVVGRVQDINESGTNNQGEPAAYITIQQIGSYRVKGVLGELQRGGIQEGDRVTMVSRTDESKAWSGTVALVDYENPTQGSNMDRYYGMSSDEMTAASKYPFYVDLDSTEGLMLGQHLYIRLETEEGQPAGIPISSAFLCYAEDGSAFVWAEHKGKLEKRPVTLGEYNAMTDAQEILSGISLEDYLAFPDETCQEGVSTTREQPAVPEIQEEDGVVD
jgi:HlyD family secretion protein